MAAVASVGYQRKIGLVMLQTGFGVVIAAAAAAGFSREDCRGLSASMCACKNMVDKELKENRGVEQLCKSRGYVAGSFLLIMDLPHRPQQGDGFTTFGVSNERNSAVILP
ncbi:unnamed protein product [Sphagnum balticum]